MTGRICVTSLLCLLLLSMYAEPNAVCTTSGGFPIVTIDLGIKLRGFSKNLQISHELLFDGINYHSRMFLPSLESTFDVTSYGNGIWRRFADGTFRLQIGKPQKCGDARYIAKGDVINEIRIVKVNSLDEFIYIHGRIAYLRSGNTQLYFEYSNDGLATIRAGDGEICLTRQQITDGRWQYWIEGHTVECYVGPYQRIERCKTDRGASFRFEYIGGLLVSVSNCSSIIGEYRWGRAGESQWWMLVPPLPPVVIQDQNAYYDVRWVQGHFIATPKRGLFSN